MNLKNISNDNLLLNIKKLSSEERKITTEILHHLKEIETRKLHLKLGYSSLYEYSVKELGYSEGSAYRRINAMRLLKAVPEVESKIHNGTLSLEGASKIQKFITTQKKEISLLNSQPTLEYIALPSLQTKTEKLEFIESLENKSLKEIDKALVTLQPLSFPIEKLRQIDEEKIELKLVIDDELKKELDRLKNLLAHRKPNMSYRDLIKYLAHLGLKKFDPSQKVVKIKNETESDQKNNFQNNLDDDSDKGVLQNQRDVSPQRRRPASQKSRNIPSAIKQEVYMRDKGHCAYTDPKTQRRCQSRHLLQYDHKYPYSLGGETSVSNLRLLCFQHHKYVTENVKNMGVARQK